MAEAPAPPVQETWTPPQDSGADMDAQFSSLTNSSLKRNARDLEGYGRVWWVTPIIVAGGGSARL